MHMTKVLYLTSDRAAQRLSYINIESTLSMDYGLFSFLFRS